MQLYFIRHAQSLNNALWDQTGSSTGRTSDAGLTPTGAEQARVLAAFLCSGRPVGGQGAGVGFGLTHLYTSLMTRAVATGWEISRETGLPLEALADVYEEGGVYLNDPETGQRVGQPGPDRAYFQAQYPGIVLPGDFVEHGWWNSRLYETGDLAAVRAASFLRAMIEAHGRSEDRVAVISHGAFFNHLMAAINGRKDREGVWYVLNNASISRFDFWDGEIGVIYLNRTDHIPAELLS